MSFIRVNSKRGKSIDCREIITTRGQQRNDILILNEMKREVLFSMWQMIQIEEEMKQIFFCKYRIYLNISFLFLVVNYLNYIFMYAH